MNKTCEIKHTNCFPSLYNSTHIPDCSFNHSSRNRTERLHLSPSVRNCKYSKSISLQLRKHWWFGDPIRSRGIYSKELQQTHRWVELSQKNEGCWDGFCFSCHDPSSPALDQSVLLHLQPMSHPVRSASHWIRILASLKPPLSLYSLLHSLLQSFFHDAFLMFIIPFYICWHRMTLHPQGYFTFLFYSWPRFFAKGRQWQSTSCF